MTRNLKSVVPNRTYAVMLGFLVSILLGAVAQAQAPKGAPVYKITPVVSKITFFVKASIAIDGTFDKWDASLTFTSPDAATGVLDVKIQADSVDTGSGFKDDKLKSEDFFDVKKEPYITFHSTKIVQTGPRTFDVPGTFTIRGVSKQETLTFTADREGQGTGEIKGTMAFDRKEFGMDSEVTIDFKATRVSGPPLLFKQ